MLSFAIRNSPPYHLLSHGGQFDSKLEPSAAVKLPAVVSDNLRVLEWDKVCDSVASFAGTSLGQLATKEQLWAVNRSYEESLRLLDETNAAVEMHKHGGCVMNFTSIDIALVKSAIQHARKGSPVEGREAMALVGLLQFAESLQLNLKAAIKEDADRLQRFMPVAETVMDLVISCTLVKFIKQLIDEDGSVKDSASPALNDLVIKCACLKERLSRELHRKLLVLGRKISKHVMTERYRKMQEISKAGAIALSTLHNKRRQVSASANLAKIDKADKIQQTVASSSPSSAEKSKKISMATKAVGSPNTVRPPISEKKAELLKAGDMVHVSRLNMNATVVKVVPAKEEIVVQDGNMKLKLRLAYVVT